ncbi:MAG: hypothetical protein UT30_C0005G0042 [Candidatus Uhrbacteria bacterium GW2011_GWF2_39_13]|uniref:Uncharacterized protein n=1 Tax=Candidatus Uhrbacteria bacterium GW2011_GWF2_39_13 TaxID=1618995 RepID=A0A0G0MKX1_9BACT|nr:MAG: hypothetical protein UT30_C0005G0042 [Candidatus Uhrbacteria bacterium GW2011_GWF2_39_13]HAU66436.1 hypothetical protein [Candidatus Uhrbacteria bacterium]
MYGLAFGIVIGAFFYFFGSNDSLTLHYASQFWMYWYGFWSVIQGFFVLLSSLGFIASGTVVGGTAGGLLGGLLGSVIGTGGSLLMWIPFLARYALLIGGPYLMWTASNPINNDGFQMTQAIIGAILFLIGLLMIRQSPKKATRA